MRVERELEISEWLKTAETELEIKPSQYFALVKLLEDFHNEQLHKEQKSESCLAKCDVCGCHPNVIIRTELGTFCQAHVRI